MKINGKTICDRKLWVYVVFVQKNPQKLVIFSKDGSISLSIYSDGTNKVLYNGNFGMKSVQLSFVNISRFFLAWKQLLICWGWKLHQILFFFFK